MRFEVYRTCSEEQSALESEMTLFALSRINKTKLDNLAEANNELDKHLWVGRAVSRRDLEMMKRVQQQTGCVLGVERSSSVLKRIFVSSFA